MARRINFGVVGLGMGMHHCRAIQHAKGAQLVAACELDKKRLKQAVDEFGCIGYLRWADMLKDKSIDVINVCVESGRHAQFGIAAAKAGKHLVMEKPLEITPARIKRFEDVLKKTGVKCACIFQSRLDPLNIHLKKVIDKGKMGKLIGIHAGLPWFREHKYYAGKHGNWKGTWKLDGGGSLMNQGIHTVDLIQWLAGPVRSVCGFCGTFGHKIEAEDQTVAILKFENGALGTLYTTTCARPDRKQHVYCYGEKGSWAKLPYNLELYEVGGIAERKHVLERFGRDTSTEQTSKDPMAVSFVGHQAIIEDLVQAIRDNREPAIPVEDAKHSVEIACAIYKSARTGREVRIDDVRA